MINILKREMANSKTLAHVYISGIRPILKYANQILHHSISDYLSEGMKRVQRRALKTLHPSLSYQEALKACNILTQIPNSVFRLLNVCSMRNPSFYGFD